MKIGAIILCLQKKITKKSKGKVAQTVNDNCEISNQSSSSIGNLLANSLAFFTALGVAYTEADDKCAEAIGHEASKYGLPTGKPYKPKKKTKKTKANKKKTKKNNNKKMKKPTFKQKKLKTPNSSSKKK